MTVHAVCCAFAARASDALSAPKYQNIDVDRLSELFDGSLDCCEELPSEELWNRNVEVADKHARRVFHYISLKMQNLKVSRNVSQDITSNEQCVDSVDLGEECANEAALSRTPEEVERIRQHSSQLGDRPLTIRNI